MQSTGEEGASGLEIAIIGMAGRFPGAANVDALWLNLWAGVESIAVLSDAELRAAGVGAELAARAEYVRARGVLGDIEQFDPEFFGFTAREAAELDPQHRLFLECAWEAFERAGYDPERCGGAVGVYAGSGLNDYLLRVVAGAARMESAAQLAALLGVEKDYLATRVSYKLGLEGPSVAVQTACSTSLVAVHLACQALLTGECDLALAGGVSIAVPQTAGYVHQPGGIGSPDGHCRAFDASAQGTVPASGVGVVLLRRLQDALAARDSIAAVIRGSAINNDGRARLGFTAPGVDGQSRVIRAALAAADVEPDSIGYVEAHGTGTPLGDPIELAALTQAFRARTQRSGFCGIGSVKTNLGHLDAAAGVTGLIKAALALQHRALPASLHFRAANPAIDFAASPFYVVARASEWPEQSWPRRAGVSSFGLGGTNAHVVLEEAPALADAAADAARPAELLVLSARSRAALQAQSEALAAQLERRPELAISDIAYTLQCGRRAFAFRRSIACQSREQAVDALRGGGAWLRSGEAPAGQAPRPVALLFPGQGAQYAGMARGLYAAEPRFREPLDECAERLRAPLGTDLRALLFEREAPTDAREGTALDRTEFTQPALFALEYALAQLWMAWGVQPCALLGHSLGELTAACVAGTLTLHDALAVVAARGRLMQQSAPGAMLAVHAPQPLLERWCGPELALAAINGPAQCVLSGSEAAVAAVEGELAALGHATRRLRSARAFHSPLMDSVLEDFRAIVAGVELRAPRTPWLSNVTGAWITDAQAQDPGYWAQQLRAPVRFGAALQRLAELGAPLLLECGPGRTLGALARAAGVASSDGTGGARALASLPGSHGRDDEYRALLDAAGELWSAGVALDWERVQTGRKLRRVVLPTYPFERRRCWRELEPTAPAQFGHREVEAAAGADPGAWFYTPRWTRAQPARPQPEPPGHWLVFADAAGIGERLAGVLEKRGARVTRIHEAGGFERRAERVFALRPPCADDYLALGQQLERGDEPPAGVVHAWSLLREPRCGSLPDVGAFQRAQRRGAASALGMFRMLGRWRGKPLRVLALVSELYDVTGHEALRPEHAPWLGICRTAEQEQAQLRARVLDVDAAALGEAGSDAELLERIADEALLADAEPVVALRGRERWLQSVDRVSLPAAGGRPGLLREGGVYAISGGLGGVALAIAEVLARAVRARLVLFGRSAPSEAQRAQLRALEALGSELLVLQADVTRSADVRAVAERARERFGGVHGVIHAAGVAAGGLLERGSERGLWEELGPKALGALALEEVFGSAPLDFVLYCSSLSAWTGGIGQAVYCGANAFLDALAAAQRRGRGRAVLSIGFDRWKDVGMAARAAQRLRGLGLEGALASGMTAAQGQAVVQRVLSGAACAQLLVSVQPLADFPCDPDAAALRRVLGIAEDGAAPAVAPRSGPGGAAGRSPAELEAALSRIWVEAFGDGHADRDGDFFALGGESLLALQLLERVRTECGVSLTPAEFFAAPSLRGLSARVLQAASATPAPAPASAEPALVALPRRAVRLQPGAASGEGDPR